MKRKYKRKKDGGDLVFDTADEYEKYLKNKNLKEAIADSIKDELQGGRYDT